MTLKELRFFWYSDLYRNQRKADLATFLRMLLVYWESPGYKYSFWMRLCRYLRTAQPRVIMAPLYVVVRLYVKHLEYKFHIRISPDTQIGCGLYIGHFGDIGVNSQTIIGENCNISQGVSLGAANRGPRKGAPIIGDDVFIGPGAKVIGRVHVGNNVAIGANCVVTKDVPDDAVVVGVPAKIVSWEGSEGYVVNKDYDRPAWAPARRVPCTAPQPDALEVGVHY